MRIQLQKSDKCIVHKITQQRLQCRLQCQREWSVQLIKPILYQIVQCNFKPFHNFLNNILTLNRNFYFDRKICNCWANLWNFQFIYKSRYESKCFVHLKQSVDWSDFIAFWKQFLFLRPKTHKFIKIIITIIKIYKNNSNIYTQSILWTLFIRTLYFFFIFVFFFF